VPNTFTESCLCQNPRHLIGLRFIFSGLLASSAIYLRILLKTFASP